MGDASIDSQSAISRQFTHNLSQGAYFYKSSKAKRVYTEFYIQSTEILSLLYLFFSFLLHIEVAGSPLLNRYNLFSLGTTASNGNCLYLGCCSGRNAVPSFCFGECDQEMPLFGVTE